MHSIRIKITAATLAAVLITVFALGGIGLYTVSEESDRTSAEKMHLISENERKSLDAYLTELRRSVDMASKIAEDSLEELDTAVIDKAQDSPGEFDSFMKEHCKTVQKAFGSFADTADGVETYYYCVNSDLGSSEHGFFYSMVGSDDYEEQEPLDSSELDPDDTDHTRWYYSPVESGQAVWVGPYTAHFLDEVWTVSYVLPIYKDDYLIGVMGMDILFDTMVSQIKDVKVYDTGHITLLSSDGLVLYHPSMPIGSKPDIASESLSRELFSEDSSGDRLIRYETHDSQRQMAFSTLSNGMKLAVSAPVSEITAHWHQLTRIILLISAGLLVLFALLIMLSMGLITKPLLRLSAAAQRLADGDYDVELSYEGNDEVGVLTRSFRQMRDQLQLHIEDLNTRAYSDALTGVKNKGAFDVYIEKLNEAIRDKDAEPPEFAIAMFDCNNLKNINDKHGHDCGDIYLQTACQTLCGVFCHSPVFRVGGDEFVVLLQRDDYRNRTQLFADYKRRVSEINASAGNPWEKVNLSMGAADYIPGRDKSADQVLHRADVCMYEDKSLYKSSIYHNNH